ncbi:MAG TPA: family 16 glycoside hydrolase [Candidatus Sulfotelmatobacter sp.]|nr:family 16 glycoside hydrolase [Candidatus Sulfotelmatobacter sp.]
MRRLLVFVCLSLSLPTMGAEIKFNFGDFLDSRELTNDFQSALAGGGRPGDWKIVTDEMPSAFTSFYASNSPVMNHIPVLAQVDTDPTDGRFPMLVYSKENFKDFTLNTQFKIISGVAEQMAGVVFHYQNESNFYVVRYSALGHNIRFYKYINGQFVDPATVDVNITPGVWHTMTVQCTGNQIYTWLDGRMVMPLTSTTTFASGKIGFWTMSDSLTHYGDTSIVYSPEIPMAQLLVQNIMDQKPRGVLELRIYTLDKSGTTRIIASNSASELGKVGTDAEKGAINNGSIYFGRGPGTVAVTMPLTDRNGDPVAAVRVELKSFLGESRDNALMRARMIVNKMQEQVGSSEDLVQ